jgi:RAVE protein 1 C terminal
MEMLARNQYAQTDERNPIDCSLFYLALRKKNLLAGLWRSAGWHSEQPAMVKFLSHDFRDSRWRTAASKNAYALLAKQRYGEQFLRLTSDLSEYAAAFFLLADSLKDAVNVCLRNLHDMQLAVGIARAYEGDDGPTLRFIIDEHVLPQAVSTGDRWLASWAFWMIGDRGKSVQALLVLTYFIFSNCEAASRRSDPVCCQEAGDNSN